MCYCKRCITCVCCEINKVDATTVPVFDFSSGCVITTTTHFVSGICGGLATGSLMMKYCREHLCPRKLLCNLPLCRWFKEMSAEALCLYSTFYSTLNIRPSFFIAENNMIKAKWKSCQTQADGKREEELSESFKAKNHPAWLFFLVQKMLFSV